MTLLVVLGLCSWFPSLRMACNPPLQMNWQHVYRRKGEPLGLKNLGNSCYLNSVLQCLTYTPPLANFCLLNRHSSLCCSIKDNKNSVCAFCLVEKRIARSLNIDAQADSPVRIYSCLPVFAKHFRDGRQEDAHEFLRYVVEACNNVCVKLHKLAAGNKVLAAKQADSKEEPHTVVKEIFGGVLQSQVKCLSCRAESNKMDDIMDLSLDILHLGSLKEAICRYFQPEVLDGSNKYLCEKCKTLSAARKQMSVFRAPNVLVIQLKRFEGIHFGKIDRYIAYEDRLALAGHMCRASLDPRPEYALYGVVVHAGYSQESGHYYSYVRDPSERWFCCNDSHVSPVNSQSVLTEKAYMLFYVRSNTKPKNFKDQSVSQNCHTQNSEAISKGNPAEVQEAAAKENVRRTKSNMDNHLSSKDESVQTRPQLRFSIAKPSIGHDKNALVNSNGRTINGQPVIPEHEKISRPSVSQLDGSSKAIGINYRLHSLEQGKDASQVGISEFHDNGKVSPPQTSTRCSPSTEGRLLGRNTDLNNIAPVSRATEATGKAISCASGSSASHAEINLIPEKTSHALVHGNGCGTGVATCQQGSYELSGDRGRESLRTESLEAGMIESREEIGSLDASKVGAKRIKSESNDFIISNGREDTTGKEVIVMHKTSPGSTTRNDSFALEKFKLFLEREGREWLQCSGWCETVRESLRAAKRRRMSQEQPVTFQGKEERRELIVTVQELMRKQVPNELKEYLFDQLQTFFADRKL